MSTPKDKDIGFHFVISKDGTISTSAPAWTAQRPIKNGKEKKE